MGIKEIGIKEIVKKWNKRNSTKIGIKIGNGKFQQIQKPGDRYTKFWDKSRKRKHG